MSLLDDVTSKPVTVIDLDTVMPGLSLHDYGDSMRFGTNPMPKNERDLSKVCCDLGLFEQYTKGFLEEWAIGSFRRKSRCFPCPPS